MHENMSVRILHYIICIFLRWNDASAAVICRNSLIYDSFNLIAGKFRPSHRRKFCEIKLSSTDAERNAYKPAFI